MRPIFEDIEVLEYSDEIVLQMKAPLESEKVRVDVNEFSAVVTGGRDMVTVPLPANIKVESAEAHLNNGVLEVIAQKYSSHGKTSFSRHPRSLINQEPESTSLVKVVDNNGA